MTQTTNTVERAYELARSGDCATVDDIRIRLKAEGFSHIVGHLEGPVIHRALRDLCLEAVRTKPAPALADPAV